MFLGYDHSYLATKLTTFHLLITVCLCWQSKLQRLRNSVCLSRLMLLPTFLGQSSSAETDIMSQRHLSHKHPHFNKVVTEHRDSPSITRLLGPDTLDMDIVHNGPHPCPWSRLAICTYTYIHIYVCESFLICHELYLFREQVTITNL